MNNQHKLSQRHTFGEKCHERITITTRKSTQNIRKPANDNPALSSDESSHKRQGNRNNEDQLQWLILPLSHQKPRHVPSFCVKLCKLVLAHKMFRLEHGLAMPQRSLLVSRFLHIVFINFKISVQVLLVSNQLRYPIFRCFAQLVKSMKADRQRSSRLLSPSPQTWESSQRIVIAPPAIQRAIPRLRACILQNLICIGWKCDRFTKAPQGSRKHHPKKSSWNVFKFSNYNIALHCVEIQQPRHFSPQAWQPQLESSVNFYEGFGAKDWELGQSCASS